LVTCSTCGKQNKDHFKFCLGCGGELPRQRPLGPPPEGGALGRDHIPIDGEGTMVGAGVPRRPAEPPRRGLCPACGHVNAPTNRFCAHCGQRLLSDLPRKPSASSPRVVLPNTPAMLVALNPDGSEAGSFPLPAGSTPLGRQSGGLFAADGYLSPRHATFTPDAQGVRVCDERSLNGVFRRLAPDKPSPVPPGGVIRLGQQLLRFEAFPGSPREGEVAVLGAPIEGLAGRLIAIVGRRSTGAAYTIPLRGLSIGRERGDVQFPEDGYVSGLHCRLTARDGEVLLTDLHSSNGTFLRLEREELIADGETLLMGQQLYRIQLTR
jgi:pSer/pThr/pTyr-binding forkhead associated (FHA) protein